MKSSQDIANSNYALVQNQPPKTGYGFLAVVIRTVQNHSGGLVAALEFPHQRGGRPGYPAMAMLSTVILQHVLNIRYANRFLDELNVNANWLALCGLEKAPTETAYSRFRKRLTAYQVEVDQLSAQILPEINAEIKRLQRINQVPANAPRLGYYLAIDSTDIEAYGNPNRKTPRDPNATWGHRTKKNKSAGKKKDELFYGYKNHEIGDAYYGLPIGGITLPANAGDGPQLPVVLKKVRRENSWLSPKYFLADKAYAGQERLQFIVNQKMIPVVSVPKPQKDTGGRRLYDGIYNADGLPTCLGGELMEYVKSHPDHGHFFRCPGIGCHLKDKVQWTAHCDTEYWEKPEGKLLRIMGILPRFTDKWKRIYKMRTSIERYFRSAKHSRLLNRHQFLGMAKIRLHVSLARLGYLATALTHLKADNYAGMRHMKIRLPDVQEDGIYPWLCQPLIRRMAA